METKDKIIEEIKKIYDPELPVNIYDLGLIYEVRVNDKKAKILFEEIIQSNNKFYSILAFNTILEKNLISDKKQILKYFSVLEKSVNTLDNKDLIAFKKALYSIKFFDNKTGEDLFRDLINKDSILKPLAQEVLEK